MKKEKILVVDDEETVRRLMDRVLSMEGYEVCTVQDGLAALDQLERNRFDLLLTDYKMPKMNGLELAEQVRSRFSSIPVLVVTAEQHLPDPRNDGIAGYIKKPFDPYKLLDLVRTVLGGAKDPD